MKTIFVILGSLVLLLAARGTAYAWDAPQYWYQSDTLGGGE